jgi:anion-transporting  ArsA/GET3 family ATPase
MRARGDERGAEAGEEWVLTGPTLADRRRGARAVTRPGRGNERHRHDPYPGQVVATRAAPRTAPVLAAGIPSAARLHVVTGKGGTGKTTAAAALALALVETGRKVLLVEVEARQAIAQLFNVAPLPYEEIKLTTGGGGRSGGQLYGLAIDAEQAMIEYLDMFYGLKRSARGLKKMGAVDFVTTLAPGLRDVLLTGKVKESVVRKVAGTYAYDAVVLDAPPTGRISRFLDATQEVAKLTKFGPINSQSEGVIKLLHGPQTVVHVVTLLEEMPVQETLDAAHELAGLGFHLGAVIVNRARPTLIAPGQVSTAGRVDEATLATGLAAAGIGGAHTAALAREMIDYAQRQQVQQDNELRLDALDLARIELPDLNPPVELGELKELAACFLTQQDAP